MTALTGQQIILAATGGMAASLLGIAAIAILYGVKGRHVNVSPEFWLVFALAGIGGAMLVAAVAP